MKKSTYKEKINIAVNHNKIELLGSVIISGPINVTSYLIWKYILKADIDMAKREWARDGDKVPSEIRPYIVDILGCRTHGNVNCTEGFCGIHNKTTK